MNDPALYPLPATDQKARDTSTSVFVSAQDGLRLHVREYGARGAPALPVVCLPGITRTAADFAELAPALAAAPLRRRVIVVESRGRGLSEYDSNPDNYNLAVELGDVFSVLTALAVAPAVFVGTSRGGILTMLLGAAHPTAIAGAVLHDIGPVIEARGQVRIKGYVGKLPQPRSFEEGADILRRVTGAQFPNLTQDQWLAAAHRAWQMKNGALVPTYDVRLAQSLASFDLERPIPALWNEFDSLKGVPMLVIRGGNSDILSAETVAAMRARRDRMEVIEVADQGHAPLLEGEHLLRGVIRFVEDCEAASRRTPTTALQ